MCVDRLMSAIEREAQSFSGRPTGAPTSSKDVTPPSQSTAGVVQADVTPQYIKDLNRQLEEMRLQQVTQQQLLAQLMSLSAASGLSASMPQRQTGTSLPNVIRDMLHGPVPRQGVSPPGFPQPTGTPFASPSGLCNHQHQLKLW